MNNLFQLAMTGLMTYWGMKKPGAMMMANNPLSSLVTINVYLISFKVKSR
jgi:hypothetical protein